MGETTGARASPHPGRCRGAGVRLARAGGARLPPPGAGPPQPRRRARIAVARRAADRSRPGRGAPRLPPRPHRRPRHAHPGRGDGGAGRLWRAGGAQPPRHGRRGRRLRRHADRLSGGAEAPPRRPPRPEHAKRPGARPARRRAGARRRRHAGAPPLRPAGGRRLPASWCSARSAARANCWSASARTRCSARPSCSARAAPRRSTCATSPSICRRSTCRWRTR